MDKIPFDYGLTEMESKSLKMEKLSGIKEMPYYQYQRYSLIYRRQGSS